MSDTTKPKYRSIGRRISHSFLRKKPAVTPAVTTSITAGETSTSFDTTTTTTTAVLHHKRSLIRLLSALNLRRWDKAPLPRTSYTPPPQCTPSTPPTLQLHPIMQDISLSPGTSGDNGIKLNKGEGKGNAQYRDHNLSFQVGRITCEAAQYGDGWEDSSMSVATNAMRGVTRLHSNFATNSSRPQPMEDLLSSYTRTGSKGTVIPIKEEVEEESTGGSDSSTIMGEERVVEAADPIPNTPAQATESSVTEDRKAEEIAEAAGTPSQITITEEATEKVAESGGTASLKTPATSVVRVPGSWID